MRYNRTMPKDEVLYQSSWVSITHRGSDPEALSIAVDFPRTHAPGFRCGPGDAHELGQALFHVGRRLLSEEYGVAVRPMPGYDAPT